MLNLSSSVDILIVQNNKNSLSQIWAEEAKKQFKSVIDFHQCNYTEIPECLYTHSNTQIILDLSDDLDMQLDLALLCKENKKIHLVTQKKYESDYHDEWTYSIFPSELAQMNAYLAALNYFNWTRGLVITDEDSIYCKQKFSNYSENFDYLTIESSSNVETLVARIIKPLGATLYYVFANSELSLKIQEALKSKKLFVSGDGIILNQNSGYGCSIDGAIIITSSGQEYANSQDEFLLSATQNLFQYLVDSSIELATVERLKYLLKKYNEKNQFSIVNTQNSKREIVGLISNKEVTIFQKVIFPGNSNDTPKSGKKALHVTVSGGSYNPGSLPVYSLPVTYYGAYTAWSLINDGTLGILKNFQVKYFIFDCGALNYDQKYATACFSKDIDKFGLAHMGESGATLTIAVMKLFKSLNLTIPFVGALVSGDSLSSTAQYPLFTRVIISNRYILSLSSLLLKALGWNEACVLYYNDTPQILQYNAFKKSAEQYGIKILNSESSRSIPIFLNRTSIKLYTNSIEVAVNTQARLLILLLPTPHLYFVVEELYDLGLRRGDLFIFVTSTAYLTMVQYDFMYTFKIKEIGVPMITIFGQNWVGKLGQFAYSKITSLYKADQYAYACYSYDAGYFIANALDYMINQGLDYYDPYQTMAVMRAQRFTGCTGTVSIDKNSNDRIMETFDIWANKIDAISGNATAYKIGEFRPYSGAMLSIESPIIYGDGTNIKPDDLRNQNRQCPFSQELVRSFTKGKFLAFGICFGFALVSLASTMYIWKKWWNINIEELKERHEISLEDYIVQLTIGIEFFQFAAMGPDITPISDFLAKISSLFSLNLQDILKL